MNLKYIGFIILAGILSGCSNKPNTTPVDDPNPSPFLTYYLSSYNSASPVSITITGPISYRHRIINPNTYNPGSDQYIGTQVSNNPLTIVIDNGSSPVTYTSPSKNGYINIFITPCESYALVD